MTAPTPTEAEQRAASMARHPAGRGLVARALVTLAAAGLVAGATSVVVAAPASAATSQCAADPMRCDDPRDIGYLGPYAYGDGSVTRNGGHFTFWQRVRGLEKQLLWMF